MLAKQQEWEQEDQFGNVCPLGEFKSGFMGLLKELNELLVLRLPPGAGIFHVLQELHA